MSQPTAGTNRIEFYLDTGSVRTLRMLTDGANIALVALDAPGRPYTVTDAYGLFSPDGTRRAVADCSHVTVSGGPGQTNRWDPWHGINAWYRGAVEGLAYDYQPRSVRYAPLWLIRYTLAEIEANGKSADAPGAVLAALGFQFQPADTSSITQMAERYDEAHINAVADRLRDTAYSLRRETRTFHVSRTEAERIIKAVGRRVNRDEIQAWSETGRG